jgi:hypothetical protein
LIQKHLDNPTRRQFSSLITPRHHNIRHFTTTRPQKQEPIRHFQQKDEQKFKINDKSIYESVGKERWRKILVGSNISKDPSKLLTWILATAIIVDMTVTHLFFKEDWYKFFSEDTVIDVKAGQVELEKDIEHLEKVLILKRLQVALEGKASVFGYDDLERRYAMGNWMLKASSKPVYQALESKILTKNKEWIERFGLKLAQDLANKGRYEALLSKEVENEMWFGDLSKRGLIGLELAEKDNINEKSKLGQENKNNIFQIGQDIDDVRYSLSFVDDILNKFDSSGGHVDVGKQQIEGQLKQSHCYPYNNYGVYVYNAIHSIHPDISTKLTFSQGFTRAQTRSNLINQHPIIVKETAAYVSHFFNNIYFPKYNIVQEMVQYRHQQMLKWAQTHLSGQNNSDPDSTVPLLTPEQLTITPHGDLYEYYRGPSGVITRKVDYRIPSTPEEVQAEGTSRLFERNIVELAPYHWDQIALEASLKRE